MSSSAVSCSDSKPKYDVFISFRGQDTRNNFTSHLLAGLRRKKINTFIDDKLCKGNDISASLLTTIQESKISVIIFSENFGNSRWCLNELVEVMECIEMTGHIVLPVFYLVDPSDVRNQTGKFGDSFNRLVNVFENEEHRWRSALERAGNLAGWDSSQVRPESLLVEEIVDDVLRKLSTVSRSNSCKSDPNALVKKNTEVVLEKRNVVCPCNMRGGVVRKSSKIDEVMSLLRIELPDVRVVGILGPGGIGKTTIAQSIFDKISSNFEGFCVFLNVSEMERRGQLAGVRDSLLSRVLENSLFGSPSRSSNFNMESLSDKKVLIVLDDVNDSTQLNTFFGGISLLGLGSRVIIITRNAQVLDLCSIKRVYNVQKLNDDAGMQLFCQHAFRQNHPGRSYERFSKWVVDIAEGNPLALKVLGSSLYCKDKSYWEKAVLQKLHKIPKRTIMDVLRISFDDLNPEQQDIFLHILRSFNGKRMDDMTRKLSGRYNSLFSGLDILICKSLIIVSPFDVIEMHNLVREMGLEIIQQKSTMRGWNRSSVWFLENSNSLTEVLGPSTSPVSCPKDFAPSQVITCRKPQSLQNSRTLSYYFRTCWQNSTKSNPNSSQV